MSHYNIWQNRVAKDTQTVLILEEIIPKLEYLMEELQSKPDKWDLVYIGRKILHNSKENQMGNSEHDSFFSQRLEGPQCPPPACEPHQQHRRGGIHL